MKPTHARQAIEACMNAKQSVFVWGQPGIGKSAVIKNIATERGIGFIDLRLSQLDTVDLRGFPMMKNDRMEFAIPGFLPTDMDSEGIIVLEELNSARPDMQATAYQFIHDRQIGAYKLPPKWSLIAAGNRDKDNGVTYSMGAPLSSRFVHVDFEVDFDDWRQWAVANGIAPEITNFISFRPALLNQFDPLKRSFPTPRTWEFVSKLLGSNVQDRLVESHLIDGSVGPEACAEFRAFLKIYRDLPNPDMVLMNPSKAPVPDDLATLYALCGALAARTTESNFGRLIEYCARLRGEFQVLTIKDACMRNKELAHTAEFADWTVKNFNLLS